MKPGMPLTDRSSTLTTRCADGWRPDDAAVHHSGHAHVVHVLEAAGHHLRHVEPPDRRPEHRPLARMTPLGAGIERDIELPAADQLAVGHPVRVLVRDDAVAPLS